MIYVHINRPSSTRFVARVRRGGCRNWTVLGNPTKSKATAFARMSKAMAINSYWKRGDVLIIADYYDPERIVEMVLR